MTLTDNDVAELARAVVDRRHPERDITIVPADPVDPYRREVSAWTVEVGGRRSYITSMMSELEAREKLVADLGDSR
jgi:hypothetical protein